VSRGEQGDLLAGDRANLRGADLAREALRAAREASARKAEERARADRPKLRVVSGRGRRRRWSGAGPDDRDPQPFGRLVSRVSVDRGWSNRLTDATVLGRWPQLVGPDVADHCTPVSLRDGELTLQAESTAWATQLRTLQRQLLTRLAPPRSGRTSCAGSGSSGRAGRAGGTVRGTSAAAAPATPTADPRPASRSARAPPRRAPRGTLVAL
jgi:predicted nucleic acid-binding Zn ribbon protein